jgi:hypothetical protein
MGAVVEEKITIILDNGVRKTTYEFPRTQGFKIKPEYAEKYPFRNHQVIICETPRLTGLTITFLPIRDEETGIFGNCTVDRESK